MENETEQIFKEQLGKLPSTVVDFVSSTNWDADLDEVGSLYNFSEEKLTYFKREATLVVIGLVHPDAFGDMLKQEVGIKDTAVLEGLVANVEKKIFAPIRPALIEFFEKEASESEGRKSKVESDAQTPDLAPDNLPTEETAESFLPKLTPKIIMPSLANQEQEAVHPFEEKMKEFFTAGQKPVSNATVESARQNFPQENLGGQAIPQTFTPQAPKTPPPYGADPYREAIE